MRSCACIGNFKLWITCVLMFLTILSMSDCLGICLQIIDNGVSIGTSAWGVCVYSISRGQMVLTGSISKSRCFSDILYKTVCTGVNCWGFSGNNEYFSVINLDLWSCLLYCLTVFNFATVNLSDFLCSALISVIICQETVSLFRLLGCCWGCIVGVFAAVSALVLLIEISGFGLGGLLHFHFTGIASNVFVL